MLQINPHLADRRAQILDAAERCFVRAGFHRTTMHDVAVEAGMSAGNLYRYFPSKDAIVAGITERDRRELAESFASLREAGGGLMDAFAALGRKHFEDEPRDKAVLCLEIWAEATRNRDVQAVSAAFAAEVVDHLAALIDEAREAGRIRPILDSRTVATLICTIADGLYVRRAVKPDFDPARDIPPVMSLIGALVSGDVTALAASQSEDTP